KVDGLGGVAREDDLFLASGVEKAAHLLARVLVGLGRGVGEVMQPAMYVGVFGGIGVVQPVEHRLRLLRRGGVVEVDERLAIDLHRKDGKVRADALDVIGAVGDGRMHRHPRASSQATTRSISASRKPACSMPSTASPTKA